MKVFRVNVPLPAFPREYARSYIETYLFAPPVTVYGMLLSLIGEVDIEKYKGVKLAFAYKEIPFVSKVMVKRSWTKYSRPGNGGFKEELKKGPKPGYVEILDEVDFLLSISDGELLERIESAITYPENVSRFGCLSLGPSECLVDDFKYWDKAGDYFHLSPSRTGNYSLPIWIDRNKNQQSRQRFEPSRKFDPTIEFIDEDFVMIG